MKFNRNLLTTLLISSALMATGIAPPANYSSLITSQNIQICDCIPVYRDSVSILCTVQNSYRGNACIGDTISIQLFPYRNYTLLELGDTLLVFADSSRGGLLFGPHRNGFTLLNGDIASRKFDVLSDDDLMRLISGDSLSERLLEFQITIHFPLSERKITFPLMQDESYEFIEFMNRSPWYASLPYNDWDEFPLVNIPEMGLFEVRLNINRINERGHPLPFRCEFYPVHEDGIDSTRGYFTLLGNIIKYEDGIYYVNCLHNYCLTYDDFVRFINGLELFGGLVQVEIEDNRYTDSYSSVAYLALDKARPRVTHGAQLYSIDLLGVSSLERFGSYGEWNCIYFTNEGYLGNSLQHYEEVLSIKLPDEPIDGLRDFRYSLFHLSHDSVLLADLSQLNFSTGDSCYLAELRIHSFVPEFYIGLIRRIEGEHSLVTRETISPRYAKELFTACFFPNDTAYTQYEVLEYESNNLWKTVCGEDESDIVLRIDEMSNASLETSRMTFHEISLPSGYSWCSNNEYLLMESQSDMDRYLVLIVFMRTEACIKWKCRASAHEILRNMVFDEPCYGSMFIATFACSSSADEDSLIMDYMDFEYSGNY